MGKYVMYFCTTSSYVKSNICFATADQYIERTVHKIGRKHNVTVATSDGLEQIIIMGQK